MEDSMEIIGADDKSESSFVQNDDDKTANKERNECNVKENKSEEAPTNISTNDKTKSIVAVSKEKLVEDSMVIISANDKTESSVLENDDCKTENKERNESNVEEKESNIPDKKGVKNTTRTLTTTTKKDQLKL